MQDVVLSPTDFVALLNQTLEFAYPSVVIEGEIANFRVAKNRWVYFSLKDDVSSVDFFGAVYQLPGPLEDGLMVRVNGMPRLHHKFGFTVNVQSISPVGEGSIKKAADLLRAKLETEGLFEQARKRALPVYPEHIGLVTAEASAAYADFIKILNQRWSGVAVNLADVYVQGEQAPGHIIKAIEYFNQLPEPPEVLVITRGGGSAEDLAAFSDERVVRAVAASRVPTLLAVGHETDESLAELAADVRASTPSNAAQLLVPDKAHEISDLNIKRRLLGEELLDMHGQELIAGQRRRENLTNQVFRLFEIETERLGSSRRLAALFDPAAALKRGYAIVRKSGRLVTSVKQARAGDKLGIELADGKISAEVRS